MIKKVFYLLMICQLSFAGYTLAQQNKTKQNVLTNNAKYIVHTISKGETIFSICKKYNIDEKELMAANPTLAEGLKTGNSLNIPLKKTPQKKREKNSEEFILHTVKQGETLYSLSKKYNVDIETIGKFNPEAKEGVKVDQVIRIPGFSTEAMANDHSKVKKVDQAKKESEEYEVEQGETFFGLLRKFGITKSQLLEANPGMDIEIKVGQLINIPKTGVTSATISSQGKYIDHKVEPGETIYGLSAEYGVKVFEIMEINPGLKDRGLVSGEVVFIPKQLVKGSESNSKDVIKSNTKNIEKESIDNGLPTNSTSRGTYRIAMFLPLFLNENEAINKGDAVENVLTDTLNSISANSSKVRSLFKNSRDFLSFYEGFLIALDTMKKTGINIEVDVHDSQLNQTVIDSVMRTQRLRDADLIVGPVYVKHQKNISAYSYKNQIPLVSPFESNDDFVSSNPFYFQVNPTTDYVYRKTAEYIGREYWDKNVIIITPYSFDQLADGDIVELVREKLKANSTKNHGGPINFSRVTIAEGYWEIKENLKKGVENIVFILPPKSKSEREAILSKAINSLYVLSEDYNIALIGMKDYADYKSINVEYFHKLNMHFLTPNFIDYSDREVNCFIRNYRKQFLTEPNPYSYRGYDIAKYFLEAYRIGGKNYLNKISASKINTLQSKFKMKRIKEFSGFMNNSLFVVNYSPECDVKVVSILSD